jgi:D-alanyl-D-alanine carboxypeptidase (penicillin-binding protein 5/6)
VTRVWLAFALISFAAVFADAGAQDAHSTPPPRVAAAEHYLVDYASNTVLSSSAADEPVPPASLTKLMTAYVVFEALEAGKIHLDDEALVSKKAWRTGGSRMFIDVNSHVRVDDLVHGMLIQSGNDASMALAEHVAGSVEAFVALMNDRAAALGMKNSVFKNPTGLPARGHVSSAHDMAILARAIISTFPKYYGLYAEREFSYNGITQHNRNALLSRDLGVDGMKTGFTDAAGYCIVTSAQRDGMRLIAVVLGAQSPKIRNNAAQSLLQYGFANFETHKLYAAHEPVSAARVTGGSPETASLGLEHDLFVTIPRGTYAALAATTDLTAQLIAPLREGTPVGEMKVSFEGNPVTSLPLIVLKPVLEGGVWTKVVSGLGQLLE